MRYAIIIVLLCLLIFSFCSCSFNQKPKPQEKSPQTEITPSETTQNFTSQMVEEYAMIHQISDPKVAEYYLAHPDYAKTNPYVPTDKDISFYESKFLLKVYPNLKKDIEKDGFTRARARLMNAEVEGRSSANRLNQVTVDEKNSSEQIEFELNNATALYNKGLIDEAIEHLKLALSYRPETPTVVYDLGVMYMKKESYREAMGCFQKTLEYLEESGYTNVNILIHPKVYMGACTNLGMIYTYLGIYDEAVSVLSKAVKFQPRDFDANWNLAVAYFNKKDSAKASLQLKKCIELDPDNAQMHNAVGIVYYNMLLYNIALDEFQTAVKLDPKENQYGYNEGLTLARMGRSEEAIQAFKRASEMKEANDMYRILSEQIKSNKAKDFYNKGCAAMEAKSVDEAIESFNSALGVKPDMVEAYVNLGYCYRIKRDPQKQVYYFEEAAKLSPDLPNLYYNLGLAYNDAGMILNAKYALEKAVDYDPSFKDAHFNLGMVYFKYNRIADAAGEFDKCVGLSPNWFEAHLNLGNCYLKMGNIEEAINQFTEATSLKPKSAEADYDLGIALTKAKRYTEAKELFQKAIKFDPSHKQARQMLEEINNYQNDKTK